MQDRFKGFQHQVVDVGEAQLHVWTAGSGEPLLLLHGYPQTHMMWHRVAPVLAGEYRVIVPDLRGYGDSSCPDAGDDHAGYSKRAMGEDQFQLMDALGYSDFFLMGHDRGARVCHQMVLDHPERIRRVILLDIMSTLDMYENMDMDLATTYYHWFFLIQGRDFPEKMILHDPAAVVESFISRMRVQNDVFPDDVMEHYIEKFSRKEVVHATCEDYRAAATVDLQHQREALKQAKFKVPMLVLWGTPSLRRFDVLGLWREKGENVSGLLVENSGHYIAEENPGITCRAAQVFFRSGNAVLSETELAKIRG